MAQDHHQDSTPQYPLEPKAYKLLGKIGSGVSATVYKALCLPMGHTAGSVVAIKTIDLENKSRAADFENLRRETKTMSLLSHPNVLRAHCSFTAGQSLWVVMPFMSCGSLQSIVSSAFPDGLSEPCIAVFLKETLSALSYIHGQGHIHRDIKAGNILVDGDGSVKLADFGVSASIYEPAASSSSSSSLMLTDMAGTPYWMAPEVVHSHTGYSFKADIWSFGITALELAHGCPPLAHLPPSQSLLIKITKRFRFSDGYHDGDKVKKQKKFSKSFQEIVGACLNQDPGKRPSAEKLLRHAFFKNCKGAEFLVKNVLQGLFSVEERFSQSINRATEREEDVDEGEEESEGSLGRKIVKHRRISGWNYNEEEFELSPVFPAELEPSFVVKRVRFGGEAIIRDGQAVERDEPGELVAPCELDRAGQTSRDSDAEGVGEGSDVLESSARSGGEGGNSNSVGEGGDCGGNVKYREGDGSGGEAREEHSGGCGEEGSGGDGEETDAKTGDDSDEVGGDGSSGYVHRGGEESGSSGNASGGGVHREVVLERLMVLKMSLDDQRSKVANLIAGLGGDAGPTREDELGATVERLRAEMEAERQRRVMAEAELEFYKGMISGAYSSSGTD